MWASHLDGTYLGEAPDADTSAAAAVPTTTPEGVQAPSVPVARPLLLGLSQQQWIGILTVAALTILIIRAVRRKRA